MADWPHSLPLSYPLRLCFCNTGSPHAQLAPPKGPAVKTSQSITKWLPATLLLFALAFAGCAPKPHSYGSQEIVRLERDQPAPWAGWLLADAELELLLKQAAEKQQ